MLGFLRLQGTLSSPQQEHLPVTQVLGEHLKEPLGQEEWAVGPCCQGSREQPLCPPPASSLFLPRSHKGRGLRVDASPTTQPQCRGLPHGQQTPCSQPHPEQAMSLPLATGGQGRGSQPVVVRVG